MSNKSDASNEAILFLVFVTFVLLTISNCNSREAILDAIEAGCPEVVEQDRNGS